MSEKLIPCPICGSENTVRLPYNDRADIERCKNCNLTIIVPIGYTMWNTRPIEDALNARIAELEEENDRLQDAWFNDETICPDGSLKPKVSDFLNRIAKLEAVIDQLIEAGEKMFTAVIAAAVPYDEGMREWDKIVNDWKEG